MQEDEESNNKNESKEKYKKGKKRVYGTGRPRTGIKDVVL